MEFTLWALLRDRDLEPPLRPTMDPKKLVQRYFQPAPPVTQKFAARRLGLLAVGIAVLALAGALTISYLLAVLLPVAVGVWMNGQAHLSRYRTDFDKAEPKPTDSRMDEFLAAARAAARARALRRLDLDLTDLDLDLDCPVDPDHHPLVVHGPVFDKHGPVVGDDRKWRFRTNEMMVVCPTPHHIGIFECRMDIGSGKCRSEEVREVYYSDLVTVAQVDRVEELKFDALNLDGTVNSFIGGKLTDLTELQLALPSADRCEILVAMSEHHSPSPSFRLQASNIDQVLPQLRNLLRTRK